MVDVSEEVTVLLSAPSEIVVASIVDAATENGDVTVVSTAVDDSTVVLSDASVGSRLGAAVVDADELPESALSLVDPSDDCTVVM